MSVGQEKSSRLSAYQMEAQSHLSILLRFLPCIHLAPLSSVPTVQSGCCKGISLFSMEDDCLTEVHIYRHQGSDKTCPSDNCNLSAYLFVVIWGIWRKPWYKGRSAHYLHLGMTSDAKAENFALRREASRKICDLKPSPERRYEHWDVGSWSLPFTALGHLWAGLAWEYDDLTPIAGFLFNSEGVNTSNGYSWSGLRSLWAFKSFCNEES